MPPRSWTIFGDPPFEMYRPGGPSLAELAGLGVARITFGGGLHPPVAAQVRDMADALAAESAALGVEAVAPGSEAVAPRSEATDAT